MSEIPQKQREHPVRRRFQPASDVQLLPAATAAPPAGGAHHTFWERVVARLKNFGDEFYKGRSGWGASLILHAALLLCLYGIIIGIETRPDSLSIDTVIAEKAGEQPFDNLLEDSLLDSVELELPQESVMSADQEFPLDPTDDFVSSNEKGLELGDSDGGEKSGGRAGFFGASAAGESFVFIVDSSGSMTGKRFDRAKRELFRSIRNLSSRQSFHVVFFNSDSYPMYAPREEVGLVAANSQNIKKVRRWIRRQQPGSTTNPIGAIELALRLKPSVIFLLSDGEFDTPVRSRQAALDGNTSGTIIHTIALISRDGEETLKTIADDHGGTYRFVR